MHRAHRLLSESTRILCTLRNGPGGRQPPGDFAGIRSISEPKVFPIRAAIPNHPENRNKFRGYSNRPELSKHMPRAHALRH
jgi:hypothetical protein